MSPQKALIVSKTWPSSSLRRQADEHDTLIAIIENRRCRKVAKSARVCCRWRECRRRDTSGNDYSHNNKLPSHKTTTTTLSASASLVFDVAANVIVTNAQKEARPHDFNFHPSHRLSYLHITSVCRRLAAVLKRRHCKTRCQEHVTLIDYHKQSSKRRLP